jgi:hypothetical protein
MLPEDEPECVHCHAPMEWVDCWNCDEGLAGHDCGEDTCCCLDPEDNVLCDICEGKGGWMSCARQCMEVGSC